MNTAARILIATEAFADAELVRSLLHDEFRRVETTVDPARALHDFERVRPDVLILAFDEVAKSELFHLGLYRLGASMLSMPHRTVLLCGKDELKLAYELCRQQRFDDYVLFWPLSHDAPRLPMAVHHALRFLADGPAAPPTVREFAAAARGLARLEASLSAGAGASRADLDAARRRLARTRAEIEAALDDFSHGLSHGELNALVESRDVGGLQRQIARLKDDEIGPRLQALAAAALAGGEASPAAVADLAAALESAQALRRLSGQVRPLVLLVDDDEFQHVLMRQMLADIRVELACVTSGAAALGILRNRSPDLILMDVDLPDIDGVAATRRIKATDRHANVQVLMITGHSDKDVVVQSRRAGASGFLVKPFDRAVLLAKVRACLGLDDAVGDETAP